MDLWIRSQNKHSITAYHDIQLDSFNLKKDKVLIISSRTSTDCVVLGEYATETRALEVLDEIQNAILGLSVDALFSKPANSIVYEMPEA